MSIAQKHILQGRDQNSNERQHSTGTNCILLSPRLFTSDNVLSAVRSRLLKNSRLGFQSTSVTARPLCFDSSTIGTCHDHANHDRSEPPIPPVLFSFPRHSRLVRIICSSQDAGCPKCKSYLFVCVLPLSRRDSSADGVCQELGHAAELLRSAVWEDGRRAMNLDVQALFDLGVLSCMASSCEQSLT